MIQFIRQSAIVKAANKMSFLLGRNYRRLPFLYILFIISSGIEFLGIGLIGPFIGMITYPAKIISRYPWIGKMIGNIPHQKVILTLGGLLVLAFAMKGVAFYVVQKQMIRFAYECRTDLVSRLLSTYQRMPYHLLLQRNSSAFIVNLNTHTNLFSDAVLMQIMRGSVEIFVLIGLFGLLAYINFWAVVIPGVYFGVVLTAWDFFLKRRLFSYGRTLSKAEAGVIAKVNHAIGALKEIRLLGCEKHFHDEVIQNAEAIAYAGTNSRVLQGIQRYIFETSLVLLVVIAICGIIKTGGEPALAFATLGVFGVAATRILPSISQIGFAFSVVRSHLYAVDSLYRDLNMDLSHNSLLQPVDVDPHQRKAMKDFQTLSCRNLDFSYPGNRQTVLKNINLNIRKGESIGIIGKSGAGKSTLVDIMLGLLTPAQGGVYIDEQMVNPSSEISCLQAWQSNIFYIPQDLFLLDDTVRRNIALGFSDNEIDDTQIQHAIEQAELSELVNELPAGPDTMIGERGTRLSGGQRQRIGLARAFYFGREVVVMDEATSSLDSETEADILKFINAFRKKRTIIIIAHRLSTIRTCDRIYRLHNGRIVDVGSYNEVVSKANDFNQNHHKPMEDVAT